MLVITVAAAPSARRRVLVVVMEILSFVGCGQRYWVVACGDFF